MQNLLKNNFFSLLIVMFLGGCSTSSYKVFNQKGDRMEILTTPDRITMTCEDVQDPEEKPEDEYGRYGFSIYVLTDKNVAIDVSPGNVIAKSSCFVRMDEVKKIIRNGKRIYIGGMGDLEDYSSPDAKQYSVMFPNNGTFPYSHRGLQFMIIMNEVGDCMSIDTVGTKKPCPVPHKEFPIQGLPPGFVSKS